MAKALNENTATLPLLDWSRNTSYFFVGRDTFEAIDLGITSAILGAADRLIRAWSPALPKTVHITGGHGRLFAGYNFSTEVRTHIDPSMTLDGIRLVAERLP
jgi:pantothenate kinase type III